MVGSEPATEPLSHWAAACRAAPFGWNIVPVGGAFRAELADELAGRKWTAGGDRERRSKGDSGA